MGHVRATELLRDLSTDVRQMREDAGLSQRRLAAAANVAAATLSDMENGNVDPGIETLARVAAALGGRLDVRIRPGTGPLIRDHLQVLMTRALLEVLHPRWGRKVEVAVYRPVRGVIDLVLGDGDAGPIVACESHSDIRRVEQQVRWAGAKADALALAHADAGDGRPVSRLMLLRSSAHTRAVAAMATDILSTAYPGRSVDAFGALTTGSIGWPGPSVIWVEVDGGSARLLPAPPRGIRVGR